MAYATIDDVEKGFRTLDSDEKGRAEALLDEAAVLIDSYSTTASADAKKVVSCRMVRRAIGDGETSAFPMGASQGSVSALGYSQSWTIGSGSTGQLYLDKTDKQYLGLSNKIGSYSPVQESTDDD
jgi:hypothetical protein